jgi:hypothetical protein
MNGLWTFIKRFGNPAPGSHDWWITWSLGILFFGGLLTSAILYMYFTQPPA